MKCPTDDTTLVMSDRNGIEIDYCPQCRGVWLDRGELDKIIDRAGAVAPPAAAAPAAPRVDLPQNVPPQQPGGFPQPGYAQPGYPQRWGSNSPGSAPRYGGGYGQQGYGQQGYPHNRRKNWLSELFD
jgi:Zn-finger nucleic acid-binding protein